MNIEIVLRRHFVAADRHGDFNFRFWSSGNEQYVNICDVNGFSITDDTSEQNNASGNGYSIGLGGGGGDCTTQNICIQVAGGPETTQQQPRPGRIA